MATISLDCCTSSSSVILCDECYSSHEGDYALARVVVYVIDNVMGFFRAY